MRIKYSRKKNSKAVHITGFILCITLILFPLTSSSASISADLNHTVSGMVDNGVVSDGMYSVNVELWHATMEKLSMGSKGLAKNAEMEIKNGKIRLILATERMQMGNIITSLAEIYYFDDEKKDFVKARGGNFTMDVGANLPKRAKLFEIFLNKKEDFNKVMVNPMVELMGNKPIEARLKIDWSSAKPITHGSTIEEFEKDAKMPETMSETGQGTVQSKFTDNGNKTPEVSRDFLIGNISIQPGESMAVPETTEPEDNLASPAPVENTGVENNTIYNGSNTYDPQENMRIIVLGSLFLCMLLIASLIIIYKYMRKLRRELKRAHYLYEFESELDLCK